MNYNEINIEEEVNHVVKAVDQGTLRPATKRESMAVQLAALSKIVHELQILVENDKELMGA
jgi:hypothetical protein